MTTPSGILAWGQAGNYNAINDRLVIRALSGGSFGLTQAPTLTAGSGLTINIGPWNAVVDCGDGTSAVVGLTAGSTINETAGGGSQRTDVIWCDINPDGATWTVSIITLAASSGRTGVALGQVVVPAGAATAAAMTLTPGSVAGGRGLYYAQKAADLGRGTTFADDPDLTLTVPSPGSYTMSAVLSYKGGTGASEGDLGFIWNITNGQGVIAAGKRRTADGNYDFQRMTSGDTAAAQTIGLSNSLVAVMNGNIVFSTGPTGTITLRWAKNTAADGSTQTTLQQYSYLQLTKAA